MPVFKVQAPDGTVIKIEAADQATAIRGAQEHYASKGSSAPKPKRSWQGEVTGFMANVNRGLGIGDEVAAGAKTVGNIFSGKVPITEAGADFKRSMADQRQIEDSYAADRPNVAALARGTGMAATALVPAGNTANIFAQGGRVANMARGAGLAATQAGAYAAADRGTLAERGAAAGRAMTDPVTLALGAGGGALATARKVPAPKPAQAPTSGEILADIGVSSSIPQRMGKTMKGAEDLGKRAPIVGQAMTGFQERQLQQLNRGIGLKALEPIGEGIPKNIKPGFDMVNHVDDRLSAVYDKAAEMTPRVSMDDALIRDAEAIGARRVDLAESEQKLWDSALRDRLTRLQTGEASGKMVKQIQSELRGLQAEQARKGNETLSSMFGDLRRAIMGTVARANPEAAKMVSKADEGWKIYSIMNDAAAAASAKGGVFLPGHLNTQVRKSAKAMGSNMAGKGKGPLQDIATAASEIIPDSYGNPGTANALAAGGGFGAVIGALTNPASAVPVALGTASLGAAATPYFMMGRKVIESLPPAASRAQLAEASRQLAELASRDPAVAALQREVAARLSRAAGVAGGARASGQSAPNIYAQP